MNISEETIKYITRLSRLEITEDNDGIIDELKAFVGYMDILNTVNTDGAEPMSHIIPIENIMREDTVLPSFKCEDILKNAPSKNNTVFVVPKTVE